MRYNVIFPVLLVWSSLAYAAIPDLSKFKDNEPDVVHELSRLRNEKVLPVMKEITKELLRPTFDVTEVLKKLKQMKDEYQNEGAFLVQRYSHLARNKKAEPHQANKVVTSKIQEVTRQLKKADVPNPKVPFLSFTQRNNETQQEL
ncbi:hypothetical protein K7432_010674 [Basidiobolus ranarum]|uniref:Uncharacterized protein n=1 Tax=Basidiobolus ranarum TaxID=34480 RepID=A0ABR2WNC9_9FUNG